MREGLSEVSSESKSEIKRPVVAIDCDGVLVDNVAVWDRYFSEGRCGKKHAVVYDPTDWDRYDKLCKECFHACLFRPEILYALSPRPDAEFFLGILAAQFDLWLVTSRPESTAEVTKNWLFWNGIYQHLTGFVFTNDKRKVCESLGAIALVEDAAHNIEAVLGSGVHPIVWDHPYNRGLFGLTRVRNWGEATKAILEVAAGRVPGR